MKMGGVGGWRCVVGETMARRLQADFVSDSGCLPVLLTQSLIVWLCS